MISCEARTLPRYDWSNAKAIWANTHPMSSEELITKQVRAALHWHA